MNDNMLADGLEAFNSYGKFGPHAIRVVHRGLSTSFDVYLNRFRDVRYGNWAYESIEAIASKTIVSGYEDGTFKPNNTLTRAEAAKMVVGALGLSAEGKNSNFKDVPSTNWSYGFVSAAYEAGIIQGYEDGTFRPNGKVTRAEIASMLSKAFHVVQGDKTVTFTDIPSTNWAYTITNNLASNGIIRGYEDGTFKPNNLVTRAEFSSMLFKSMEYLPK